MTSCICALLLCACVFTLGYGLPVWRCPEFNLIACKKLPATCSSYRMIYIRHFHLECPACLICVDDWFLRSINNEIPDNINKDENKDKVEVKKEEKEEQPKEQQPAQVKKLSEQEIKEKEERRRIRKEKRRARKAKLRQKEKRAKRKRQRELDNGLPKKLRRRRRRKREKRRLERLQKAQLKSEAHH